jgi:uncharacterized protein YhdP
MITLQNEVTFLGYRCSVIIGQYEDERISIQLEDKKDGIPVATASVNLIDVPMKEDEVAIKDYSENAGMLEILVNADIISMPFKYADNGFVQIPICKITRNVLSQLES